LRTSRFAEWEIRVIWNKIANIVSLRWPNIYYGGKMVPTFKEDGSPDGLFEWTGLQVTGVPRERPREKKYEELKKRVLSGEVLGEGDFTL